MKAIVEELYLRISQLCNLKFQTNLAVPFINNQKNSEKPFLMVLSPPAPHDPFTPANRHIDKYKGTRAKRTPSFNYAKRKVIVRKPLYTLQFNGVKCIKNKCCTKNICFKESCATESKRI